MPQPEHDLRRSILALGETLARVLLTRTFLGTLVQQVASLRMSVHAKLLGAFLLVALLFTGFGLLGLRILAGMSQQGQLLDQAHERVDTSRQIKDALAMQANLTALTLLLQDRSMIENVLRENNRFNDTMARLEGAATSEERDLIERIRAAQDEVLTVVADIANLVRDGNLEAAMALHVGNGYPLYERIERLVDQVIKIEQTRMDDLRWSVAAANRRAGIVTWVFTGVAITLALVLGFVISWSLILPVRQAEGFLAKVAKGKFDTTINVANQDEFGALAAYMNEIARELHRRDEEQRDATKQAGPAREHPQPASEAKSA